jgi:hypothetical protein
VGTAALGNGGGGIVIENGATATVVGASSSSRNLISGNAVAGVLVTGVGTDGNSIIANLIGTNAAETASIPNPLGVRIEQGAAANHVGLNSSGDGNVISGNSGLGVSIATGANGNFVQGNQLEGNGGGVGISASSGNLVGGTGPSPVGNTIVSNSGPGVAVDATAGAANGNSILLNTIAANSAASIVLTAGANHAQAAPAIKPPKNARPGKKSTISGSLLSSPATVFRIEIYETGTCDQAASFLGGGLLTTNKNGKAAFKLTTFGGLQKGTAIESTATNMATGDTSALSACVLVK